MTVTLFPKNTTFGTPPPPSTFLPMTSFEVDPDPGWFTPLLTRKERPMMNDLYPVLVFSARYGGAYEGAPWIAIQEHTWDSEMIADAQAGDIACHDWFAQRHENQIPTGRGNSPDEAVADLAFQLHIPWTPGEDSLHKRFEKALEEARAEKEESN